jgi:hypothetical protein
MRRVWKSTLAGLAGLFTCMTAGETGAGVLGPSEHNRLGRQFERRPMVFFVAKGPADSCGKGCSEWIAAVGSIDLGAPQRFREFIDKLNGRKLPIFFHSPGGLGGSGANLGLILRERRMTAGVGRTEANCGVFNTKDIACQKKISARESIAARLVTREAACASACVYAFAGASVRHLPLGALLGVHAPGQFLSAKEAQLLIGKPGGGFIDDTKTAENQRQMRRYFLDMGVSPDLLDFALKTPHEKMYILDRSEITRFGLETRREGFETSWVAATPPKAIFSIAKSFTRRKLSDPAEYLTAQLQFYCDANGRASLWYQRELPVNSSQSKTSVHLTLGDETISFQSRPTTKPGIDIGAYLLPLRDQESFAKLATAKALVMIEKANESDEVSETRLSTGGLEVAVNEFRQRCLARGFPSVSYPGIGSMLPPTVKVVPVKPAMPATSAPETRAPDSKQFSAPQASTAE